MATRRQPHPTTQHADDDTDAGIPAGVRLDDAEQAREQDPGDAPPSSARRGDPTTGEAPDAGMSGVDPDDLDEATFLEDSSSAGVATRDPGAGTVDEAAMADLLDGEEHPAELTPPGGLPGRADLPTHDAAASSAMADLLPGASEDRGSLLDRSGIGAPGDSGDMGAFGEIVETEGGGSVWYSTTGEVVQQITPDGRVIVGEDAYQENRAPSGDDAAPGATPPGGGADPGETVDGEDDDGPSIFSSEFWFGNPGGLKPGQGGQGGSNVNASRMASEVEGHAPIRDRKTRNEVKEELEDGTETDDGDAGPKENQQDENKQDENQQDENKQEENEQDEAGGGANREDQESYTEDSYDEGRNDELRVELRGLRPSTSPQGDTVDPHDDADAAGTDGGIVEQHGTDLGLTNPDGSQRAAAPEVVDHRGDDVDPLEHDGPAVDDGAWADVPDLDVGNQTIDLGLDEHDPTPLVDPATVEQDAGPEASEFAELDILD